MISASDEKIKLIAVINFIGSHDEPKLLKKVMLNIQPATSNELRIITIKSDVNKINLREPDFLNNSGFSQGIDDE